MRAARLVVGVMVIALLAAGCAASPAAPEGTLAVNVTQGRFDRGDRIIAIEVTNEYSEPVQLIRASLATPQFEAPAEWSRGTTLPAGVTVALRSPIPAPVCPIPEGSTPMVTVEYETADGSSHSISVEPSQSTNSLATIGSDECIAELVAERVDLTRVASVEWTPGAHSPATVTIAVVPTGADGTVTIQRARSTVLLSILDAAAVPTQELPIDLTVDATSVPSSIVLRIQPARCDQHAVIEDKRGTIFPFQATTSDGVDGVVYVTSSDEQKFSLYRYVGDYCGF